MVSKYQGRNNLSIAEHHAQQERAEYAAENVSSYSRYILHADFRSWNSFLHYYAIDLHYFYCDDAVQFVCERVKQTRGELLYHFSLLSF